MSVKIRLSRSGKTHHASYRIVAQDTKTKRDGTFLEILGFYNPGQKGENTFQVNNEKVNNWIKKGAKPTESVTKLLAKNNGKPS